MTSPYCVFPTPVGVFLTAILARAAMDSLPHARGGVSVIWRICPTNVGSSPRPWGCFWRRSGEKAILMVFPTPVGVFPRHWLPYSCHLSLPHARGGVSSALADTLSRWWSSPRPWGCFFYSCAATDRSYVFPTPVGVFPTGKEYFLVRACLPHARGGVSVGRFLNSRRVGSHLMLC